MNCPICNTKKRTKQSYDRHVTLCQFTSISAKDRKDEVDFYEKIPEMKDLFKIVIQLCEENKKLVKRVEVLERNSIITIKRNIEDYLVTLDPVTIRYQEWLSRLIITEDIFKKLLETSLTEGIKELIERNIYDIPMKAFIQRNEKIFIYDNGWREFDSMEMEQFTSILSHRFSKKYMEWKIENRERLKLDPTLRELDILYMQKVNGLGKPLQTRSKEIKKWLFIKLKIDMKEYI